jgi:hypothetical protein
MTSWEYLLVELPTLVEATSEKGHSAAVACLNREGELGWEAVSVVHLERGAVAVLLKRALP